MPEDDRNGPQEANHVSTRYRRARTRRRAAIVILQMAAIVFSILLALLLDEWRQGVTRAATMDAVLEAVRAEAETNRAELEGAVAHHEEMLRQMRSGGIEIARLPLATAGIDTTSADRVAQTFAEQARHLEGRRLTGADARRIADGRWDVAYDQGRFTVEVREDTLVLRGTGNIRLAPPFLTNVSWETAQVTQVAVGLPPDLVALLTRIEQLHRRVEGTTDRLVDMIYGFTEVGAGWEGFFTSALADLVSFERAMIEVYDELLAVLGER